MVQVVASLCGSRYGRVMPTQNRQYKSTLAGQKPFPPLLVSSCRIVNTMQQGRKESTTQLGLSWNYQNLIQTAKRWETNTSYLCYGCISVIGHKNSNGTWSCIRLSYRRHFFIRIHPLWSTLFGINSMLNVRPTSVALALIRWSSSLIRATALSKHSLLQNQPFTLDAEVKYSVAVLGHIACPQFLSGMFFKNILLLSW